MQFLNDLCSAIWFKIALIVYEIIISNTPFYKRKKERRNILNLKLVCFMW
jgi:hypothetical protein